MAGLCVLFQTSISRYTQLITMSNKDSYVYLWAGTVFSMLIYLYQSLCRRFCLSSDLLLPSKTNFISGATQARHRKNRSASFPKLVYASLWLGNGPKIHFGVGCDYCGVILSNFLFLLSVNGSFFSE